MSDKEVFVNFKSREEFRKPEHIDEEELSASTLHMPGSLHEAHMVAIIDTYGYITYANRKFAKVSGYEKKELIGIKYEINFHPIMPNWILKKVIKYVDKAQRPNAFYTKNITKQGKYYFSYVRIELNRDGEYNMYHDIPHHKEDAEKAVELYKKEKDGLFKKIMKKIFKF